MSRASHMIAFLILTVCELLISGFGSTFRPHAFGAAPAGEHRPAETSRPEWDVYVIEVGFRHNCNRVARGKSYLGVAYRSLAEAISDIDYQAWYEERKGKIGASRDALLLWRFDNAYRECCNQFPTMLAAMAVVDPEYVAAIEKLTKRPLTTLEHQLAYVLENEGYEPDEAKRFLSRLASLQTRPALSMPTGIAINGNDLFVAEPDVIRKVVIATGEVSTLAGVELEYGDVDGTADRARFDHPSGMTTDGKNLFVADTSNHTIRQVMIGTGKVSTLAGLAKHVGSADGVGDAARFTMPYGISRVGTHLFVADALNGTIRTVVIATGEVTTLAGSANQWGDSDGDAGRNARFLFPTGIASDGIHLFVTDTLNSTIRKIAIATGEATTLAGSAGQLGDTDGKGRDARFLCPSAVTCIGENLFVIDLHSIRKVEIVSGIVQTIAKTQSELTAADVLGKAAMLDNPQGIASDQSMLYLTDSRSILRLAPSAGDLNYVVNCRLGSETTPTTNVTSKNGLGYILGNRRITSNSITSARKEDVATRILQEAFLLRFAMVTGIASKEDSTYYEISAACAKHPEMIGDFTKPVVIARSIDLSLYDISDAGETLEDALESIKKGNAKHWAESKSKEDGLIAKEAKTAIEVLAKLSIGTEFPRLRTSATSSAADFLLWWALKGDLSGAKALGSLLDQVRQEKNTRALCGIGLIGRVLKEWTRRTGDTDQCIPMVYSVLKSKGCTEEDLRILCASGLIPKVSSR